MDVIRGSDLAGRNEFFEVLADTERSQVAWMILQPGQTSGEFGSDHPNSDQVLIVMCGEADVRAGDETVTLVTGDFCLIPAGEPHQVIGRGDREVRTLNVYSPPAY